MSTEMAEIGPQPLLRDYPDIDAWASAEVEWIEAVFKLPEADQNAIFGKTPPKPEPDDGPTVYSCGTPGHDYRCPKCGRKLIPIVYGYPSAPMLEASTKNLIKLGGCVTTPDDPEWWCEQDGALWYVYDELVTGGNADVRHLLN